MSRHIGCQVCSSPAGERGEFIDLINLKSTPTPGGYRKAWDKTKWNKPYFERKRGDGLCRRCHGDECEYCRDSGICQTCEGKGFLLVGDDFDL